MYEKYIGHGQRSNIITSDTRLIYNKWIFSKRSLDLTFCMLFIVPADRISYASVMYECSPSASQIQDPKTKVVPVVKLILKVRSAELSRNSSRAPIWRASCRCFTTDSLPRGYPGQLFGLWRIAELGGWGNKTNVKNDLYWFEPSRCSSNSPTFS